MTHDQLEAILKLSQAKSEKDGFSVLPEGTTLTVYVAHGGGTLTMGRVEAIRSDGDLVYARTSKKETFAVAGDDVFAVAMDGGAGQPPRRPAGFG